MCICAFYKYVSIFPSKGPWQFHCLLQRDKTSLCWGVWVLPTKSYRTQDSRPSRTLPYRFSVYYCHRNDFWRACGRCQQVCEALSGWKCLPRWFAKKKPWCLPQVDGQILSICSGFLGGQEIRMEEERKVARWCQTSPESSYCSCQQKIMKYCFVLSYIANELKYYDYYHCYFSSFLFHQSRSSSFASLLLSISSWKSKIRHICTKYYRGKLG